MDKEFQNIIGDDGIKVPGLGLIIYKDGKEIYSKFLGRRVIETNQPVTRHTKFRAASVSKMFTVFSLLQLAEQNKISLDADVSEYLGFELRNPNFPQKKITVRMLASHTSTLRDGKIYSIPPDVSVKEFFAPDGRYWEGGAHFDKRDDYFAYCNLNYGLLGTIIEAVTGERFDIYQKKNILSQLDTRADYVPANLSRADFNQLGTIYQKKNPNGFWNEFGAWYGKADDFRGIQPPKDTLSLQNPYDETFQHVYNLKNYRAGINATIFSPQGGLRISFEELAHALEFLMNGGTFRGKKILSKESVETILKPHWIYDGNNGDTYGGAIQNYGLGVYKIRENLIGHSGVAFGMIAGLFFIPNTKTGFVYMMNGTAIDEDNDPRANCGYVYVWENLIINAFLNVIST